MLLMVLNRAVHYESGETQTIPFFLGEETFEGFVISEPCAGSIKVPLTNIEALRSTYDIGTYCLVCDIEGSEWGIVSGSSTALKGCEQLIIELHDVQKVGNRSAIEVMKDMLVYRHGFHLVDSVGSVYVFERN